VQTGRTAAAEGDIEENEEEALDEARGRVTVSDMDRDCEGRYRVLNHGHGAEVIDSEKDLPVAWCGDTVSWRDTGTVRISGMAVASRIARLLNDDHGRTT
jgi:predicted NAD/FAD-dependent oxidoreductase